MLVEGKLYFTKDDIDSALGSMFSKGVLQSGGHESKDFLNGTFRSYFEYYPLFPFDCLSDKMQIALAYRIAANELLFGRSESRMAEARTVIRLPKRELPCKSAEDFIEVENRTTYMPESGVCEVAWEIINRAINDPESNLRKAEFRTQVSNIEKQSSVIKKLMDEKKSLEQKYAVLNAKYTRLAQDISKGNQGNQGIFYSYFIVDASAGAVGSTKEINDFIGKIPTIPNADQNTVEVSITPISEGAKDKFIARVSWKNFELKMIEEGEGDCDILEALCKG